MIRLPSLPWVLGFILAFQALTGAFAAIGAVGEALHSHHAQIERVTG